MARKWKYNKPSLRNIVVVKTLIIANYKRVFINKLSFINKYVLTSPGLRPVTLLCLLLITLTSTGQNKSESTTLAFNHDFHGVVRARWEMDTENGYSRFQVRNARLSARADINSVFTAYIQADFCDAGKIKILDAWAGVNAGYGLNFRAGQFRMPFGEEPFMAPATYLFNNRSFMGKDMCNIRAVGAQASWKTPGIPLTVTAGIFNPCTISEHNKWTRSYAASAKVAYSPGNWRFTSGFMTTVPDSVRANLIDAAIQWYSTNLGLRLNGEYMHKHYAGHAFKTAHAWLFTVDWQHPMRHKVFNRWSVQLREDGITAHSNGTRNARGILTATRPLTNRITPGITISHIDTKGLNAHLRLNYEKYFYGRYKPADEFDNDRLSAEIVVVF